MVGALLSCNGVPAISEAVQMSDVAKINRCYCGGYGRGDSIQTKETMK